MTSHIGTSVIKKNIYSTGCVLREFWTTMNKVQSTSPHNKNLFFLFSIKDSSQSYGSRTSRILGRGWEYDKNTHFKELAYC